MLQLKNVNNIDGGYSIDHFELKVYNKNKGKLPISFKNYFESIFKTRDRFYLSDSYERYLSSMYDEGDDTGLPITKSGKISVIILSVIIVVIAVIGYVVFKFGR